MFWQDFGAITMKNEMKMGIFYPNSISKHWSTQKRQSSTPENWEKMFLEIKILKNWYNMYSVVIFEVFVSTSIWKWDGKWAKNMEKEDFGQLPGWKTPKKWLKSTTIMKKSDRMRP